MNVLAFVRPDSWDAPAVRPRARSRLLFGGCRVGGTRLLRRPASPGARAVPALARVHGPCSSGVWPAYILMRGGAQWIYDKESLDPEFAPLGRHRLGGRRRRHPRPPDPHAARLAGPPPRQRRPLVHRSRGLVPDRPGRGVVRDERQARRLTAARQRARKRPQGAKGAPQSAVSRLRVCRIAPEPLRILIRFCRERKPAARHRTGRYLSISHWLSWTRYSSHSFRLSST